MEYKNEIYLSLEQVVGDFVKISEVENLKGYIYDSLKFIEFIIILEENTNKDIPLEYCTEDVFSSVVSIDEMLRKID